MKLIFLSEPTSLLNLLLCLDHPGSLWIQIILIRLNQKNKIQLKRCCKGVKLTFVSLQTTQKKEKKHQYKLKGITKFWYGVMNLVQMNILEAYTILQYSVIVVAVEIES